MAGVPEERLVSLVPAVGVNNLGDERAQPGNPLRAAVNVDINREGRVRRRAGRTEVVAAAVETHSIFAEAPFPWALYADGPNLVALDSAQRPTTIGGALASGLPISFARINDAVFYSNGVQSGMVTADLELLPWAPEAPAGQPLLEAFASGGLAEGGYQVAITYRDVLGRESGAGVATQIDVAAGQGIRLVAIPQPIGVHVTTVRVYRTDANDTTLRHVRDIPVGMTTLVLGSSERGRHLDTQHLRPLPAGHIVRYGHGRQWVARGNELLWSEPLRYGLFNPGFNRVRFGGRVSLVRPVGEGGEGAGVFVSAGGRTFWIAGADPANFVPRIVDAAEAVEGTDALTPGRVWKLETSDNVAAWLSTEGYFCIGMPGGTVMRLRDDEVATDVGERGAVLYREERGIRQLVASLQGRAPSTRLRIGDAVVARELGPAP
ncbi:MAG: hypothetical protein ACRC2H_07500 [Silanimonas sp.]